MTAVPRSAPTRRYSAWEWTRAYLVLALWLPLFPILWWLDGKTMPTWLTRKLLQHHLVYAETHPMDFRIPPDPTVPVYMQRWWRVPRNWATNIYFHVVRRSDDDRALHDHPWFSISIVLHGGYWEHTISAGGVHHKVWCPPGLIRFRSSGRQAHRLELAVDSVGEVAARTIFVTGPVLRRWGFHDSRRWVDAYEWDAFCAEHGIVGMKMDGGSDAVVSDRNKLTRN